MSASGQNKQQRVHDEVREVVGIMQNNIDKVMERGERLETLQTKTDDLQQSSMQFKKGASQVRKKMWWQNMKLKLAIGGIIIVILLIIIIPLTTGKKNDNNNPSQPAPAQP